MNFPIPYHGLFVAVAGGFAVIWVGNLLTVGASRATFYTRAEGPATAAVRLVLLTASLAGIALYCIDPDLMGWAALPLPRTLRMASFFLSLAALLLFYRVLRALGRNFSTSLAIKESQTLVVGGPYRLVRHPMYTAFVALWIGYFGLSADWFIGLTGLSGLFLTIAIRTPKEEKMMIDRFGEDYRAYMERTGRYLPRLPSGHGEGRPRPCRK